MSAVGWFARCGVGAVVLLIACGLATARFGASLQMPATTTRDGTLMTLTRYLREPVPDIVLVGSSITSRLKEEYFSAPRLRNLVVTGGSPLTPLEIIARQPQLPGLILVEVNVLSRSTDTALVEKYSKGAVTEPLFFRPVRAAVAAYENWNHAPLTHQQAAPALARLLAQPPSDFDSRVYHARTLQQFNAEDPSVAARSNAIRIQQLVSSLEQRGARVLLFEIPYPPSIEASRAATITHDIIHAAFPDPARWLHFDVDTSELRWPDGVHLDERSAVVMAQSMERAFASVRGPK